MAHSDSKATTASNLLESGGLPTTPQVVNKLRELSQHLSKPTDVTTLLARLNRHTTEVCKSHGEWQGTVEVDGEIRAIPECPQCVADRRAALAAERSATAQLPERFARASFDDFKVTQPKQKVALEQCRDYVERFNEHLASGRCLVLLGNVGTGKTLLVSAMCNALQNHRYNIIYTTVMNLFREVRATWQKDSPVSEEEVFNRYTSADLLVLDEVGVQTGSVNEQVLIYEIANRRYNRLRPMVVVSNCDPDELKRVLGFRVYDRLRENDGMALLFDWESAR